MIDTITTTAGFERLEGEWRNLHRRAAPERLFLSWPWLFTWWRHLSAGRQLMILVVRRRGEAIAVAPFSIRPACMSRLIHYRALELLGTGTAGSDYLDLIVEPGRETEALAEITGHLEGSRLPLELPQVLLEDSAACRLADRLAPRGWRVTAARTNVCPYIRMAGLDWPSYLAGLGASHRANLRRRIRDLERLGEVRFDAVTSHDERRLAIEQLIAMHNARWSRRGGSDAFHTREMVSFHQEFSGRALDEGWLRLMVLRVGARPVAWFYGFRHGTVHSFYQSAFDPRWSGRSVGLVAMGLAIRSALEEGALEFDLLHGAERYKQLWARQARTIGRLELHPPFLRGWITGRASALGKATRALGRSLLRAAGGPLA